MQAVIRQCRGGGSEPKRCTASKHLHCAGGIQYFGAHAPSTVRGTHHQLDAAHCPHSSHAASVPCNAFAAARLCHPTWAQFKKGGRMSSVRHRCSFHACVLAQCAVRKREGFLHSFGAMNPCSGRAGALLVDIKSRNQSFHSFLERPSSKNYSEHSTPARPAITEWNRAGLIQVEWSCASGKDL